MANAVNLTVENAGVGAGELIALTAHILDKDREVHLSSARNAEGIGSVTVLNTERNVTKELTIESCAKVTRGNELTLLACEGRVVDREGHLHGRLADLNELEGLTMLNPDGVKICLKENPLYKANARGVDLNVNFDARYGSGEKNVFCKASENYVGEHAFSEPESIAIRDFTLKVMPDATISYHSKGQEIYYEFFQDEFSRKRDCALAEKVAKVTGYAIKSTPNSAGGYKDWCIEKLKIPALTIEVGNDDLTHPIGEEHLVQIYKQNKKVIKVVTDYLTEIKCKKNL